MLSYTDNALISCNPNWTYRDFCQRVAQIAAEFQLRKINAVSIWFNDSASLTCVLLAAWEANVTVLFPPNLTTESLLWAKANSQLWLTDNEVVAENVEQFSSFGILNQISTKKPQFSPTNQTELWLKTSGSTGEAKTIVKTAEQMWRGGNVLAKTVPFEDGNHITSLATVSSQHIYGLTVHIMMSLQKGWCIGRHQLFSPQCLIENTQKNNTVVVSSPAMLGNIDWTQTILPKNVSGFISSGGVLPESIAEEIRQQSVVSEIYGSTETGPIAIRSDNSLWQRLPDSLLGCNKNDELWIEAGWLSQREQTADVVEFSSAGFRLLGRADRIVKLADKRISLAAIENILLQTEWVEDCYLARHHEKSRLAAWIGLTEKGIELFREQGRRALISQLRRHLINNVELPAIPRFWRFTDKLPRNSQSKISKVEFHQIFSDCCKDAKWTNPQQTDNEYSVTGKVPLDLVYLADHFERFPLVPGVIELQWICEQASQLLQTNIECRYFEKLKFQKFLRPNDEFLLQLKWNEKLHKLHFSLKTASEPCCSGVAVLNLKSSNVEDHH